MTTLAYPPSSPTAVESNIEKVDLPLDLSNMQEEGVFVDVTARGFSCLWGSLSWRDLGIDTKKAGIDLFAPSCALLPLEHVQKIKRYSGRAHDTLNRHAYRFQLTEALFGSASWRWLTWQGFQDFEQKFGDVRGDLQAALGEATSHYSMLHNYMEKRASQLALSSAERLAAGGVEMPATFRKDVIERVMAMVPTPDDLNGISVSYRVGALQLGSEFLEEQRKAIEERQKILEEQSLERMSPEEREEAETKLRIRRLQIDAAREKINASLSPVDEALGQLHTAMLESVQSVLDSLNKHENVPPSTAKKARGLYERFRLMSWKSDATLERMLEELRAAATKQEESVPLDSSALSDIASEIAAHCYEQAAAAGQVSRMSQVTL